MDKPLKDWPLAEVKAECARREKCAGCPFENKDATSRFNCLMAPRPFMWKVEGQNA